jgi:hypothetical protein
VRLSGPRIIRSLHATIKKHGREALPQVLEIPNGDLNTFFIGPKWSRISRKEFEALADRIEAALKAHGEVVK